MIGYSGKAVCKGVAVGPVKVWKKTVRPVESTKAEEVAVQQERLKEAFIKAEEELDRLYQEAILAVGAENAALFEAHRLMLADVEYRSAIFNRIKTEHVNAEYAVSKAGEAFADLFAGMDDEYMRARAADIIDVSARLIRILQGKPEAKEDNRLTVPSVIVADDLSPSETVRMDKKMVLAFVTVHGSVYSHTAILAKSMNIPAIVGVPLELEQIEDGVTGIVDGYSGEILLSPAQETIDTRLEKYRRELEREQELLELKGLANQTRDGHSVRIAANIGSLDEIDDALLYDADGIGLFRSEFLYLERDDYPAEEEQFLAYRRIVEAMGEKKVIIRTLDIGADKQAEYMGLEKEANPALGLRAIRLCLSRPEIFKTQLRALLRAAVYGNLAIMYPMITSVWEVKRIKELVEEASKELTAQGIAHRVPEQGIMIETPAAVMVSDELAGLVDFFSLGTNDLVQYTLAVDRQNESLEHFCDPHHKAIMRMIRMAAENAHAHGIWIGICGELGADPELTRDFLKMGIDELSVAPSMVLKLRREIRQMRVE